jgi:hypothetical protein
MVGLLLSLLALGPVVAQLERLPPVDANDVFVCHCSNAPTMPEL